MKNLFFLIVLVAPFFAFSHDDESTVAEATNSFYSLSSEPDSVMPDTFESVEWKIESDLNNKYLWRGIEFQKALTWNPNITVKYNNFSANVWTNIPVHYYHADDKEAQDFKEIDLNVNYEIEKEISYTMISHSAQIYTPFGEDEWYWGMVNIFQGFYKGDIGIYVNPEINYSPFKGGMFYETGLNYNHENEKSEIEIYLAYSGSNKVFTQYNVCRNEESAYCEPFQTIKFDISYQYNIKSSFYIRPHFTYFHLLNYVDMLGYRDNFSFGLAAGFQKK